MGRRQDPNPTDSSALPSTNVRLDVWLDVACLFKTRSEAQHACQGGKVEIRGTRAKAHRNVRVGDEIAITRPPGRRQRVVVRALADRHLPKIEARKLYEDVSPPPSPEEVELLRLTRSAPPGWPRPSAQRPDSRARRALRRLKGRPD